MLQAEAAIRRAGRVGDASAEAAVFADALTRVLEAGGAAIERARLSVAGAAPGRLTRAVAILQPHVCAGARRVYRELIAARRLDAPEPRRALASPLAAEPTLAELALAHSRLRLYFAFLRRKTQVNGPLSPIPERLDLKPLLCYNNCC